MAVPPTKTTQPTTAGQTLIPPKNPQSIPQSGTTITPGLAANLTSNSGAVATDTPAPENEVISSRNLQDLVSKLSRNSVVLDNEVEQILKDVINDFIETSTTFACELAQHRGSNVVDLKDLQLYLERNRNIRVPGYHLLDMPTSAQPLDAHKQRQELVRNSTTKNQ